MKKNSKRILALLAVTAGMMAAGTEAGAQAAKVRLKAQHSGRILGVTGLLDNYPIMQRFTTPDDSRQVFELKGMGGNVVQLFNASSGKCATVVGTPTQGWAAILLKPCSTVETQKFYLNTLSKGVFELKTFGLASGMCATIHSGSLESGARLIQMSCSSQTYQRFEVKDSVTGALYVHGGSAPVPSPTPVPTPRPTATPGPTATPAPTPQPTPAPPTSGQTISSQSALDSALSSAKGGETLLLSGTFTFKLTGKSYAAPVVLTSKDPNRRAIINYSNASQVSNVTFRDLDFHANATNPESYMNRMLGCNKLLFERVHVYGSLDGDPTNDNIGLFLSGDGITIRESEFQQLNKAMSIGGSNIKILDNSIHDMRHDGINVGQVSNILIEGNEITNFGFNSGDHRDGMQFMTVSSTRSSTDIVIRNNLVMLGTGSSMQGIFLTDQKGNLPYQRVRIENNLVVQTYMANGIMVSNGNDVAIVNNTVLSATDDTYPVWIRMNGITGLTLVGNVAESGGNKTPAQAGIDMSLLTKARLPYLRPEQVIVPGIGFQGW